MFTVLWCFLPNQQQWAFQWLLGTVFVTLLGKESTTVYAGMKLIITDGDSLEITSLDDAIKLNFPLAIRRRCSWHIVDRGRNKHLSTKLGGYSKIKRDRKFLFSKRNKPKLLTSANKIARTIYPWMFFWAQPNYCITHEEFQLSFALFLRCQKGPGAFLNFSN